MPVPTPIANEKQSKFIGRCVSALADIDPGVPNTQRIAMCFSSWRRAKGIKEALGQGMGVGGARQGIGGAEYCICTECDYGMKHTRAIPCQEIKCPKCSAPMKGTNQKPANIKESNMKMELMEVSNRSWATVDKPSLPASCYLWVEDPKKKTTWRLPVYEGGGGIDPKTGMYRQRGELNLGALRAASAAVAGARTGTPMSIPTSVKAKLISLLKTHKIGQFAESVTIVKPQKKDEKDFTEARDCEINSPISLKEATVDKEKNVVSDVVLLSKHSANGNDYTDGCMQKAVSILEGIKSYVNHQKQGGVRDFRDLTGDYRNVRYISEEGKIRGDWHLIESDHKAKILDIAERMPHLASNSIHARGRYHRKDGRNIIEELVAAHSVDLVTNAATTKSLFESGKSGGKEEKEMEWKDVSLAELKVNRADICDLLIAEGYESRDDEVKTLTEERDALKSEKDKLEVKEKMAEKKTLRDKLLSESELPEVAVTDTFKEELLKVEEAKDGDKTVSIEEGMKKLIDDRIELVSGITKSKGVKNAGGEKKIFESKGEISNADFVKAVKG